MTSIKLEAGMKFTSNKTGNTITIVNVGNERLINSSSDGSEGSCKVSRFLEFVENGSYELIENNDANSNTANTNNTSINTELQLMEHLLNKYDNNLTLISSADYVLDTSYDKFISYSSHDSQDIQEFMSEFSTDKNDFYIETASYICSGYKYSITSVYLDDDIVMFAGNEKDVICHLCLVIAEEELNIEYKNIPANNKLINNLIDQRIDEIMSGNTPDTNIMLSERTATLM